MQIKSKKSLTHFITASSFFLSLLATSGFIFAGSLFIHHIGGNSWPKISFFCQIASAIIFFSYIWLQSQKIYYGFIVLLGAVLASLFAIQASDHSGWAIITFSVMVLLSKVQAGAVINTLQANIFGPHAYQEVAQKVIRFDNLGKLTGSLLAAGLASQQLTHLLFYLVGFSVLASLALCLPVFFSAKQHSDFAAPHSHNDNWKVFGETIRQIKDNNLAKSTLIIMVWIYSARFLVETSSYQAIDQLFSGMDSTTKVLSYLSIATMVITLALQPLIYRSLVKVKTPSTLFALLPAGILLISATFLLYDSAWLLLIQLVYFEIINKTIQSPTANQCLTSIDKEHRQRVYIMISVTISLFIMIISALFDQVAQLSTPSSVAVLLGTSCIFTFFIITKMDSFYLRSLWQQYLGFKEDDTKLVGESLYLNDSPIGMTSAETRLPDLRTDHDIHFSNSHAQKLHKLVSSYKLTRDKNALYEIIDEHYQLLKSGSPENYSAAIEALSCIGLDDFAILLLNENQTPEGIKLEELLFWLRHNYLSKLSADHQFKLRLLFMLAFHTDNSRYNIDRIKAIYSVRKKVTREALIDLIFSDYCRYSQSEIFASIIGGKEGVDIGYLVDYFIRRDFLQSHNLRHLLIRLKDSPYHRDRINKKVEDFIAESHQELGGDATDKLVKQVFLAEWLESFDSNEAQILYSFDQIENSGIAKDLWIHLHQEFLKSTRFAHLGDHLKGIQFEVAAKTPLV